MITRRGAHRAGEGADDGGMPLAAAVVALGVGGLQESRGALVGGRQAGRLVRAPRQAQVLLQRRQLGRVRQRERGCDLLVCTRAQEAHSRVRKAHGNCPIAKPGDPAHRTAVVVIVMRKWSPPEVLPPLGKLCRR